MPFLRLKFERLKRGWQQHYLARLAGLHQSEISLIETGRLQPTEDQLEAIANALSITPAAVLLKEVTVADPEESAKAGAPR